MVARYLRKACLATALLALALVPAGDACPSGNADDGSEPSQGATPCPVDAVEVQGVCEAPCPVLIVGPQPPYVDPHPECIDDLVP